MIIQIAINVFFIIFTPLSLLQYYYNIIRLKSQVVFRKNAPGPVRGLLPPLDGLEQEIAQRRSDDSQDYTRSTAEDTEEINFTVGEAQSVDTHKQGADVRDYGFDIGENFHNSQPLSLFCTLIIAYLFVNINNKLVIFRLQNFNLPGRRKRGRDCSRPS